MIADGTFLLWTLNEHLTRTALLVQPLTLPRGVEAASLPTIDVPLPLPWASATNSTPRPADWSADVSCIDTASGQEHSFTMPAEVAAALAALGLSQSLGCVRMIQLPGGEAGMPEQVRPALGGRS